MCDFIHAEGRMPFTSTLNAQWYNTPNIHLCTIEDFISLCDELDLKIEKASFFRMIKSNM